VLQVLQQKYGDVYRQDNVVLSGTHTHCGPGGYFQYTLFMISSGGFIKTSIQPLVDGIVKMGYASTQQTAAGIHTRLYSRAFIIDDGSRRVVFVTADVGMISQRVRLEQSIDRAHQNMRPGRIYRNQGELDHNSINRSPHSYLNNPEDERLRYKDNTDNQVLVLKFTDLDGDGIGMLQTNMCAAFGPGDDMFESTRIIGENIYRKELYATAVDEVTGSVQSAHQWVNMTDVSVQINDTHTVRTCKPALGHSFAAGTTDGGGALNFTQAVEGDPFWDGIVGVLLGKPSNETKECHHPKPILFNTGEMNTPLPWHPQIVDVQIISIGSVAVVAVPGEMTMSGRRLREAVKQQELESEGAFRDTEVVIAGLSNVYTHYITTYEEYQVQRYEGASTIYGPHTLSAYLQKYRGLARAIAQDRVSELPVGPEPPFFTKNLVSLLPAASIDRKPDNTSFGEVLQQVYPVYRQGDVVSVTFVAGNPRHSGDIRDKTFVTVEILDNRTETWEVVHTDASWETRFHWLKGSNQQSNATIQWFIPPSAPSGSYRIRHFGHYKAWKGFQTVISPYEGSSDVFRVASSFYY
uniref:Neutral ceramidase n=1 Tax=Acanthochromis polyacanthus TaxID=80966 RepID=A0A3Q1FQL6_9TELE